jgi:hypothetical protein
LRRRRLPRHLIRVSRQRAACVCPGEDGAIFLPSLFLPATLAQTDYATCTVASLSCTGSLGGPTRAVIPAGCVVARVWNCSGEQYQWSATGCPVRQLACPSSFVSFAPDAPCVAATLQCSGGGGPPNGTFAQDADPCVVSRPACAPGQPCFDWVRLCNSSASCQWRGLPCSSGCVVPNTAKNVCQCPADYWPPACASARAVTCQFRLRSPDASACEHVDENDPSEVDSDPVCHRRLSTDKVAFSYRIACAFDGGYVATPDNFTYAVSTANGWLMSQAQYDRQNWTAQLKVFNWLRISDMSAAVNASLSPAQLAGLEDVSFSVDLSRLSSQHLVGGRAYAEVGFTQATLSRMNLSPTSVRDRLFVDLTDLADLSAYPPAGVAARAARAVRAEETTVWSFFFGETTAMAALITAGVVAVSALFARTMWW